MADPKDPKRIDLSKADESLFTKEELAEINRQAMDEVHKAQKAEAKVALIEKAKRAARAKALPAEAIEDIYIDLPRFGLFLSLDDNRYYHGQTYKMPHKQADSVRDMMACAWRHENVAFGQHDPNQYRRELNTKVSAHFVRG